MRLCFIGNSHLSPFISNRESLADSYSVRFVAQRSFGNASLEISSSDSRAMTKFPDILVVSKEGQNTLVDVDLFDKIFVVGMGFGLMGLNAVLGTCRPDADPRPSSLTLLSEGAFEETVDNYYDQQTFSRIIEAIPRSRRSDIVLLPQTHPLDWVGTRDDSRLNSWREIIDAGVLRMLDAQFTRQIARLRSRGVGVLEQPQETVTDVALTRGEFGMAQPEEGNKFWDSADYYHANGLYANHVYRQIEEFLATAERS